MKSLKELVDDILKDQNEEDAKLRMKMKKSIMRGYELNTIKHLGNNDGLYNRVELILDRLLKMLCGHSQSIDSLERKLNALSKKQRKKPTMSNN
jgi:hypothetical protein